MGGWEGSGCDGVTRGRCGERAWWEVWCIVLRREARVLARVVLPEPGMPATAMRRRRELSVCWILAGGLWLRL